MSDQVVQDFARLLADSDEEKRRALLRRVNMQAMNMAPEESFEPPIKTLGEYLSMPIPVPPVLIQRRLLVRGGLTCTVARAGKGKTVLSMNRILRWSAGLPLFDTLKDKDGNHLLAPVEPIKTLVIENEGAAGLFHEMIGIMLHCESHIPKDVRDQIKENVLIWGDGGFSNLKLDEQRDLAAIRAGCEKFEPDLVFIEPFRGLWRGEENSATEMSNVADALSAIATDYECAVLFAHHERKAGIGEDGEKMSAGRGSTVLEGVVAVMENFGGVKGGDYRELSWSKSRYGKEPAAVRMKWHPELWWYEHIPEDQIESAILQALTDAGGGPLTKKDIAEITDESETKIHKTLQGLLDKDRVKRMKAIHTGAGSSGFRWRLAGSDDNELKGPEF